jgi:hypothetical protein
MVLGEHGLQSGEGRSRSDLGLPGVQQELLETIFKTNQCCFGFKQWTSTCHSMG